MYFSDASSDPIIEGTCNPLPQGYWFKPLPATPNKCPAFDPPIVFRGGVCEMCEKHDHHTFTKNCSPQLCFWFSMPSVQIENKTVTLEEFLTKEAKEEEDIKTSM